MIHGLHWSLLAMLELVAGSALLNLIQRCAVGSIRLSGLLVCAFWGVQQTWWAVTGANNLPLTIACDLLLLWFFWSRRASNHWSDWIICALIPATMMIYVPAYLHGETTLGWWLNRGIVALQMVLGLPLPKRQGIGGAVSHGPRRTAHVEGG